jgi:hypothetical protein
MVAFYAQAAMEEEGNRRFPYLVQGDPIVTSALAFVRGHRHGFNELVGSKWTWAASYTRNCFS